MIDGYKVAVVIPAFNEELLIKKTVVNLPDFIDAIVVVNDASLDTTGAILRTLSKEIKKLVVIEHHRNQGVGAAIASGYQYALEQAFDYTVVVGADNQMDAKELKPMLEFISSNDYDYVKGNRFLKPWTLIHMPPIRILGSLALNILTKFATGLYHIGDPQSGYTVIALKTLKRLDIDQIYPRYGYPNDLLGKLSKLKATVRDFPISAVYGEESSGLKPVKIIWPYTKLLYTIYKKRKGK